MTPQQAFNLAIQHHRAGRLDLAEAIYQQILSVHPQHTDAMHMLGMLAHQTGKSDDAVRLIQTAINLGLNTPDAFGNLGNALSGKGQFDEAITAFRQSLALHPKIPHTYINLGNALQALGKTDQAVSAFREAIALDSNLAEAFNSLGIALTEQGKCDDAIIACRHAISLRADYADAHVNLGNAHKRNGDLDQAVASYRQAIALHPLVAELHSNLASALKDLGQPELALASYREAARLDPNDARHASNLVLLLQYHPGFDAKSIAAENAKWNQQYAQPLEKLAQPHIKNRDPSRRLRIGYVSPDFRDHVVGRNILPLLAHHDHNRFEIFCYAQVSKADAMTEKFRQHADTWRITTGIPDDQLANLIREDRIDILVDLALHTSGHRLLVFARKPAPNQVCFAGYPGSTGLTAIDFRISDPYLDPIGMDESVHSEKTIRLPHSFWCYDPLDCRDIPVNPLPAASNGFITFGCLNNFCKVNDAVLSLWTKVLQQVENACLLLLAPTGSPRSRTLEKFQSAGVHPDRIKFVANLSRREYLQAYHRIDIGLDTFPYNGHTTSLDSFWMGAPVITLVGNRSVARAGWCQLSNLNLTELAATDSNRFVEIAMDLAHDIPRLNQLRSTLRQRMEQSPLMDAANFAKNIEAAYLQMASTV